MGAVGTLRHFDRGGTTSLRIHLASGSSRYFLFPLVGLPQVLLVPVQVSIFGVFVLFLFSVFRFLFFLCLSFFLFQCVSGLPACVCHACRIQYDGMALHCLLLLQHYDVLLVIRGRTGHTIILYEFSPDFFGQISFSAAAILFPVQ